MEGELAPRVQAKCKRTFILSLLQPWSVAMASADDLEQKLTCSICLQLFREPRLLPCGHTYCQHCLTSYITSRPPTANPRGQQVWRSAYLTHLDLLVLIFCVKYCSNISVVSTYVPVYKDCIVWIYFAFSPQGRELDVMGQKAQLYLENLEKPWNLGVRGFENGSGAAFGRREGGGGGGRGRARGRLLTSFADYYFLLIFFFLSSSIRSWDSQIWKRT